MRILSPWTALVLKKGLGCELSPLPLCPLNPLSLDEDIAARVESLS